MAINTKIGTLLLSLILNSCFSPASAEETKNNALSLCENFSDELIQDDYRALVELEFIDPDVVVACQKANSDHPKNPKYMIGLAKILQLTHFEKTPTQKQLDESVRLLRQAADMDFEPAIFDLFRFVGGVSRHERPPLQRVKLIRSYKVDDDPNRFISRLSHSKSVRVTDYLVGFLVENFHRSPESRKLAVQLTKRNMKTGSVEAIYNFGMLNIAGYGVEKNPQKGWKLIEKAATLGHSEAQIMFGLEYGYHVYGQSSDSSFEEQKRSFRFLTNAINKGGQWGNILLDQILRQKYNRTSFGTDGFEPNKLYETEWFDEYLACEITESVKRKSIYYRHIPKCERKN